MLICLLRAAIVDGRLFLSHVTLDICDIHIADSVLLNYAVSSFAYRLVFANLVSSHLSALFLLVFVLFLICYDISLNPCLLCSVLLWCRVWSA